MSKVLLATSALVVCVACGVNEPPLDADGAPPSSGYDDAPGPWLIGVSLEPAAADTSWSVCLEDVSVVESWTSANLPPSGASVLLEQEAPLSMARDVARCVADQLGPEGGSVSITHVG